MYVPPQQQPANMDPIFGIDFQNWTKDRMIYVIRQFDPSLYFPARVLKLSLATRLRALESTCQPDMARNIMNEMNRELQQRTTIRERENLREQATIQAATACVTLGSGMMDIPVASSTASPSEATNAIFDDTEPLMPIGVPTTSAGNDGLLNRLNYDGEMQTRRVETSLVPISEYTESVESWRRERKELSDSIHKLEQRIRAHSEQVSKLFDNPKMLNQIT